MYWKEQEYVEGGDIRIFLQEILKRVEWIDRAQDGLLF
jgi:hypothetical protein